MNAAFLIMSSAALAGADPAPPPPPPAAPVVVNSGAGCTNCGGPAPAYYGDCGCCGSSKVGLLDRIKGKFGGRKSHDCGCAPAPTPCCAPAPTPCSSCQPACDTGCGGGRANLFDKLKSRWGGRKKSCCAPACDTCGASQFAPVGAPPAVQPGPGVVPAPVPPKEMPKPKAGSTVGSAPRPLTAAPTVPTVIAPGVNSSPY